MDQALIGLATLFTVTFSPIVSPVPEAMQETSKTVVVSTHSIDLSTRAQGEVNEVFKDNILLDLHYFKGDLDKFKLDNKGIGQNNINWEKIREPFEFSFQLEPGEVFAYHDVILDEYSNSKVKTVKRQYHPTEGYKSTLGLVGNGVCHLATLINWTTTEAKSDKQKKYLEVKALVNHDFAPIPNVPREYGTAIYYGTGGEIAQKQNLYVKNISSSPVIFSFKTDGEKVKLEISVKKDDSDSFAKAN